jgi:hypothetical protein
MGHWGSWLTNGRGNPSRWVALVLAVLFAVATVAAALLGQDPKVIMVLGGMFVMAFNTAFGRRPVVIQVAAELGRRTRERA